MVDTAAFEEEHTIESLEKEHGTSSMDGSALMRGRGRRVTVSGGNQDCKGLASMAEREVASSLTMLSSAMSAFTGLPGRKAMMLFTETLRDDPGLPYYEACGIGMLSRPSNMLTVQPEMDALVREANLAGITFYPVHAGGLVGGATSPARQSATGFQAHVALATGGINSVLLKDPRKSLRQAAQDMGCHYVIAYRPDEKLSDGDHVVSIAVKRPGVKVRARQSFSLQPAPAAAEGEILAALATPGIKRDFHIEAHAYGLGADRRGGRRIVLKASVLASDLLTIRGANQEREGSMQIRGGVISDNELKCSFTSDVAFVSAPGSPASRRIGVEHLCAVPEGEHEIVVAARDQTAGSLGTFWGKLRVGSPRKEARILLWSVPGGDAWQGTSPADLFVRRQATLGMDERARVTCVVCLDGTTGGRAPAPEATFVLEGPARLRLAASAVYPEETASCRVLGADIQPGALAAGRYRVVPEIQAPWRLVGPPGEIQVSPAAPSAP